MADHQSTRKRTGSPTVGGAHEETSKKQRLEETGGTAAEGGIEEQKDADAGDAGNQGGGGEDAQKSIFGSGKAREKGDDASSEDQGSDNGTNSSGCIDADEWIEVEIDPFENDWNLAEKHRSAVKHLVVKITADLNYDESQPASLDDPDIAFDAHRIYGVAGKDEFPSVAEVFPNVQQFRVRVHVDEEKMSLPADKLHEGHIARVIKKQVVERLLVGEVKWEREVTLSVKLTWLKTPTGLEQKDASMKDSGQIAYTILTNPGTPFIIGEAAAMKDASGASSVLVPK
ncbi:hypothetical protein LTR85_009034 [Meristemomyces frigidus]|nr:hypothetical protein LTR85_009034 [Meristemomyces frigidus]